MTDAPPTFPPVPPARLAHLEAIEAAVIRAVDAFWADRHNADASIAAKRELARLVKRGPFAPRPPESFVAELAVRPAISAVEAARYRASSGERPDE